MMQIDVQGSFLIGSAMALLARHQLPHASERWIAKARTLALAFGSAVFTPTCLYIALRWTPWETMCLWDRATLPTYVLALFAVVVAAASVLGFQLTCALIRGGRPHQALALNGVAVDAVAGGLPAASLRGRTNKVTAARVLDLAGRRCDADLAALLAVFPVGAIDAGTAQIEALRRWPRDPRLAAHLLALIDRPPYRSRRALPFWEAALAIVEAVGDPRSRPAVEQRIARIDQSFAQPMGRLMTERLRRLLERLPAEPPAPDAAAQQGLERLKQRHGAPTPAGDRDALLAAIHDDPQNDELRLIFADACSAVGDPRGELIVLQHQRASGARLTPAQRQRETALLKEHTDEWLGELSAVLLRSSVRLRLGMLDAATLKPKHDAHLRPLIGDPRWSTLRTLTVSGLRAYYDEAAAAAVDSMCAVILHPVMRSLRSLLGELRPDVTTALCEGPAERPLQRLEVHNNWGDDEVVEAVQAALLEAPGLPWLRQLIYRRYRCKQPADYGWLIGAPLVRRLERLQLTADLVALTDWIPLLASSTLTTLALCDHHDYTVVELIRGEAGRLSIQGRFKWAGWGKQLQVFAAQLERLDRGAVESLKVTCRGKHGPDADQLATLAAAAERLQPARCVLP
jgi:uncharacterized protein (TIGR02996 family)